MNTIGEKPLVMNPSKNFIAQFCRDPWKPGQ